MVVRLLRSITGLLLIRPTERDGSCPSFFAADWIVYSVPLVLALALRWGDGDATLFPRRVRRILLQD
jgi:hypothetical protein